MADAITKASCFADSLWPKESRELSWAGASIYTITLYPLRANELTVPGSQCTPLSSPYFQPTKDFQDGFCRGLAIDIVEGATLKI